MPSGRFRLEIYQAGQLIDLVDEQNAITAGYRDAAAAAFGGQAGAVTQIGFGTGTAPGLYGNTSLTAAYLKLVDGAVLAGDGSGRISFAFSLGSSEANGLAIGEFGLMTAGGVLVARKARKAAAILKDPTIALQGTWTIQFKGA